MLFHSQSCVEWLNCHREAWAFIIPWSLFYVTSFFLLVLVPTLALLPPVLTVSPLKADHFAGELRHHPDQDKVAYMLQGLRHGFQLGFSRHQTLQPAKCNKPLANQHPMVIDEYFAYEVSLGRVAGPFRTPPLASLHISSFGVIVYWPSLMSKQRIKTLQYTLMIASCWAWSGTASFMLTWLSLSASAQPPTFSIQWPTQCSGSWWTTTKPLICCIYFNDFITVAPPPDSPLCAQYLQADSIQPLWVAVLTPSSHQIVLALLLCWPSWPLS